jgi:acetolactate synthase I/II/III large subunit
MRDDRAPSGPTRVGGRILVDQLRAQKVGAVFCVPGESYLPALEALRTTPEVRTLVCRHESSAANMAEAYGKMTGRPGVCFVTRGPGAFQASVGVHTAAQDSTPMLLLIGQVPRSHRHREDFQEVDYEAMFGSVAKWVATVTDASRLPEYLSRAVRTSITGRPGPVVLALPEDVLWEEATVEDAPTVSSARSAPSPEDLRLLEGWLRTAQRPTVIVGGSGWDVTALDNLQLAVERLELPSVAAFRRQDVLANDSPSYVGFLGLGERPELREEIADSDLVIAVGTRLDSITTRGFTLLEVPHPEQRLVHVHPSPDEAGRNHPACLAIAASVREFGADLATLARIDPAPWRSWTRMRRERQRASWQVPGDTTDPIASIMTTIQDLSPEGTVFTNGAGNYSAWCHRYLRFNTYPSQLAPVSGAMGYGLPAAIAAAIAQPQRQVVTIGGDGCFHMACADMVTASRYGLPIVAVILNNGLYGTIRTHQERRFPGNGFATDLVNPDFGGLARASGWDVLSPEDVETFASSYERALSSSVPTLLEIVTDPGQLLPGTHVDDLRSAST